MTFDLHQLNNYSGFIFDLDGVLWAGKEPITGAAAFINELSAAEYKVRFVSNTSSRSLQETMHKSEQFGYEISSDQVIVASRVCARQVAAEIDGGSCVYLVGTEGLEQELEAAGLQVIKDGKSNLADCAYVVCGFDDEFNYDKMSNALAAFMRGAGFAAVNLDATAPMSGGKKKPAGGAISASLEVLAARPPDIMPGKPEPDLLERAAASAGLDPEECVMIGDTPEADIAAAKNAGMLSGLVLTGNVDKSMLEEIPSEQYPDFVIEAISELAKYLLE